MSSPQNIDKSNLRESLIEDELRRKKERTKDVFILLFVLSTVASFVFFYLWYELGMQEMKKHFGGFITLGLCFFSAHEFVKMKIEEKKENEYILWTIRLLFIVIFGLFWVLGS